jgi:hypothetical protein
MLHEQKERVKNPPAYCMSKKNVLKTVLHIA